MTINLGSKELLALIAILIAGFTASVYVTLAILRGRGVLNEKYRPHRRRKTDGSKLTRFDRNVIKKAKALRNNGNTAEAARILEDNGLMREAVYIADKDGLVLQAAEILMRAGKPHRAGAIYAKHKRWKEAIDCFVQAGMPYEAATCYRKLADFKNACEYYKAAKRFGDAAWCYEQLGQFQAAARLFRLSEQPDRAAEQYLRLARENGNTKSLILDQAEIDFIVARIESGIDRAKYVLLLRRANALPDLLRSLPRLNAQAAILDALVEVATPTEWEGILSTASSISPDVRSQLMRKISQAQPSAAVATNFADQGRTVVSSDQTARPFDPVDNANLERMSVLSKLELFGALPNETKKEIWLNGNISTVSAGQLISPIAGQAAQLIVILKGEAEWRETRGGRGKIVQRRNSGTIIGTRAMLFDQTPEEQVLAYKDCDVWSIGTGKLDAFFERNPTAAKLFYKALARELLVDDVTPQNDKKLSA